MGRQSLWSKAKALVRTPAGRLLFVVAFLGSAWLLFPGLVPHRVSLMVEVGEHRCAARVHLALREQGESSSGAPLAAVSTSLGWKAEARLDRRLPRGAYVVDMHLECPDGTPSAPLQRPLVIEGELDVRYHLRDRCSCSQRVPSSS